MIAYRDDRGVYTYAELAERVNRAGNALAELGVVKPKAYVVLKKGAPASEAELEAFVKERLAPYKYPRWIEFVGELAKTATGEVQRFKLRAG